MAFFGLTKSGPPKGPERVLAYLLDAQRRMAPLKIEDAQGREVPATLDLITPIRVVLSSREPLDLRKGAETHLVFILDNLRFKAPTRVLEADPLGSATVELPRAVDLAERRKMARGYLSAREGATAMAMAGLFNPLASGTVASLGPTHTLVDEALVDEAVVRTSPINAYINQPIEMPRVVEVTEPVTSPTHKGEGAWTRTNPALDSTFKTAYLVDWLNARNITLHNHSTVSIVERSINNACFDYTINAKRAALVHFVEPNPFQKKVGNKPLTCGLTYTFMSRPLPEKWRRAFLMTSVRFEAYYAANSLRLGIRVR